MSAEVCFMLGIVLLPVTVDGTAGQQGIEQVQLCFSSSSKVTNGAQAFLLHDFIQS